MKGLSSKKLNLVAVHHPMQHKLVEKDTPSLVGESEKSKIRSCFCWCMDGWEWNCVEGMAWCGYSILLGSGSE